MEKTLEYLKNAISDKTPLKDIVDIFEKACQPINEDDLILFETGTYNFTGNELFYFSLVKQTDGEDDEYYQLHIDVLYKPNVENSKLDVTQWGEDNSIFDLIRNSQAFKYAQKDEYIKINIYLDET